MGFQFDEKQAEGFTVLPTGDYEVYLKGFETKIGQTSGMEYYNAVLVVRDDVEQEGKGQMLWDIFSLSPKAEFKFHQILKPFKDRYPDGFPEFADKAAVLDFVKGKSVIANVGIRKYEDNDGNQKEGNTIKGYEASRRPDPQVEAEDAGMNTDEGNEELPF